MVSVSAFFVCADGEGSDMRESFQVMENQAVISHRDEVSRATDRLLTVVTARCVQCLGMYV